MKIVLDEGAFMPLRAHEDDAGWDLRTMETVTIPTGGSAVFNTGVHFEIPKGYYGYLESKSGLNVKHSIVSMGGTVDCGYTGTVLVKLYNLGNEDYEFQPGDKIVQIVFRPYLSESMEIVDSLEVTERGDNGFGSSGR